MNIVKPYARIIDLPDRNAGIALLKKIEWCGRISHRSEDAQSDTSWERFIKAVVVDHGDWSITEHASVTVDFYVDRGMQQQILRHRLISPTVESTRFVSYKKKMPAVFIQPMGLEGKEGAVEIWLKAISAAEQSYLDLVTAGVRPQAARSVLPLALGSRMALTSTLRNWRHVLISRTTQEAQEDVRLLMTELLKEFQEKIPLLFDDVVPERKQTQALGAAR